ncbi:MAG: hypothetical protein OXO49_00840 [Gammaproteobacteria bacterium]|nr:hypothetical protein [Gammaproteobacteria bacterium]MDE0253130.1 hypothetical protein [Gammaproteobacteria bacterium]MDE0403624.1 hypothetical protein [Gammaproteobacteria bacterium]
MTRHIDFPSRNFEIELLTVIGGVLSLFLGSCGTYQSEESVTTLFNRHVESCVCQNLVIETDNYSRLEYTDFIESCNSTVRDSNPERFPAEMQYSPAIDELRCQEDVEPWLEVVEENRQLQENNREFWEKLHDVQE